MVCVGTCSLGVEHILLVVMRGMTIFHLPPLSNSDISVMEVIIVGEHVYVFSCALLSQM